MRKLFLSILLFIGAFIFIGNVQAKEDSVVKVYMFTKNGCSACESAKEFFSELKEEHGDEYELVTIEVFDSEWNAVSEDLQTLLFDVYEEFDEDSSSAATPTIVIGDDYHSIGLPSDTDEIYKAIKKANKNSKEDLVAKLASKLDIDLDNLDEQTNSKVTATSEEDTTNDTKENSSSNDTLIIIGIFVVVIGGIAGLVVASKK